MKGPWEGRRGPLTRGLLVFPASQDDIERYSRGEAVRGPGLGAILMQLGLEKVYLEVDELER